MTDAASGISICVTVTHVDGVVLALSEFRHGINYRSVVVFGEAQSVDDLAERKDALRRFVEGVVPGRTTQPQPPRPPSEPELHATTVLSIPLDEFSVKVRLPSPPTPPTTSGPKRFLHGRGRTGVVIKPLTDIGPRFVEMAHGIGVAVAGTADADGIPHTRVMQPVWGWDGAMLTGWLSTDTQSPKLAQLRGTPMLSLTYWNPEQDTCTADCDVEFVTDEAERAAAWDRFVSTPPPAGFDPGVYPEWDSPASARFGVLRLRPQWLRVMPGTLMTAGQGELWTWRA